MVEYGEAVLREQFLMLIAQSLPVTVKLFVDV